MPELKETAEGLLRRINELHGYAGRVYGGPDLCLECHHRWPCGTYLLTKIKLEELSEREDRDA